VLTLDLSARLTAADPRVDAVRGCVAIERGPLVYCLEETDHPGGGLDLFVLDTASGLGEEHRPELLGGIVAVKAAGWRRRLPRSADWWPYRTVPPGPSAEAASRAPHAGRGAAAGEPGERLTLTAVPYYAWANREDGAMRVWLPTS
jgi:DUF1680 family protein